jgi:nesprin-1
MLVTLKESDAFGIPHVSDLYYMIQDVSVWKDKFQLLGDTVSFLIATCEDQVAHELKERYLRISGRWEDLFQVRDLANIETDSLLCHRS